MEVFADFLVEKVYGPRAMQESAASITPRKRCVPRMNECDYYSKTVCSSFSRPLRTCLPPPLALNLTNLPSKTRDFVLGYCKDPHKARGSGNTRCVIPTVEAIEAVS